MMTKKRSLKNDEERSKEKKIEINEKVEENCVMNNKLLQEHDHYV